MTETTPLARVFRLVLLLIAFCVAGVLGGLVVILSNSAKLTEAKQQSEVNGHILQIMVALSGCTVEDDPAACKAKTDAVSVAEGAGRIPLVDCVVRRALAGLPAPDPNRPCPGQTPPEVYPG